MLHGRRTATRIRRDFALSAAYERLTAAARPSRPSRHSRRVPAGELPFPKRERPIRIAWLRRLRETEAWVLYLSRAYCSALLRRGRSTLRGV